KEDGFNCALLKGDIFTNEVEIIKELQPISMREFFKSLIEDVKNYYGKHPHQEVNMHADASQYEIYKPFVKRAWRIDKAEMFPEILNNISFE
ncbi:hypothetical protein ACW0TR_04640, partial [Fusobacterium polymorphum]